MILLRVIVFSVIAFLLAPIAIIVLFSFHATPALTFPFAGFSWRWYAQVFTDSQLGAALLKSLTIAFWTAGLTLVLGTGASLAWLRLGRRGRSVIELLGITPIALPGLFLGVALLVLFAQLGI